MYSGINKIVLTNEDGVELTFNSISSEGDIFTQAPLTVSFASGLEVYSGSEYQIKFVSYDVAHFATLKSWMENEKKVTAKVYGNDVEVTWDEDAPIKVSKLIETMSGNLIAFTVEINIKGEYDNSIVQVSPYRWNDGNGNYFVEAATTEILLYKR